MPNSRLDESLQSQIDLRSRDDISGRYYTI
jgi:hypothetical protein